MGVEFDLDMLSSDQATKSLTRNSSVVDVDVRPLPSQTDVSKALYRVEKPYDSGKHFTSLQPVADFNHKVSCDYASVYKESQVVKERRDYIMGFVAMLKDRKSTRLNSSHTVISYAVFCLKKKNQK